MGIFGTPQDQVDLDDVKARVARLESAVASLQAQVAALAGGGGAVPYGAPSPTAPTPATPGTEPPWMAEVRALAARDEKIQAIKLYRENTNLGLKEAKDAVESLI